MSNPSSPQSTLSKRQIATAAESYVAAQFALCGFDILARAGRANFHYDLAVARAQGMLKIGVHASLNSFWDIADRYLDASRRANASTEDLHLAIDEWQDQHREGVVCCLVEFESIGLNRAPNIYLAPPAEVAEEMHDRVDRLAGEETGARGFDIVHRPQALPLHWRLSQARILDVLLGPGEPESSRPDLVGFQQTEEHAAAALLELVPSAFMMN